MGSVPQQPDLIETLPMLTFRFPTSTRAVALAFAVLALACAQPKERVSLATIEQGRTYTTWLYGKEYGKLWERMTPEMQRVFGSASELGRFAGKAVTRLGQERRTVDEAVADVRAERVYSRTSSFDAVPQPMVIQWTLTDNGSVSGLVVRPADSSGAEE
ncbi:MAG TPA: hypothetical protein VFM14_11585 [Gemmatimonadales bacterium]|nr:hypothetical protein [Gemmatimonadales bacterium]